MKKISLLIMGLTCFCHSIADAQIFARGQVPQKAPVSQTTYKSLDQVLKDLEKKHSIYFMYQNEKIKSMQVQYPLKSGEDVDATLDRVLKASGLEYKKHGKIYAIFPKDADSNSIKELKQSMKQTQVPANEPDSDAGSATNQPAEQGSEIKLIGIKGKVTDEKNAGLPGVSIVIKGTQTGTTTDAGGEYQLDIPDAQAASAVLIFSFVGYESQEVPVGSKTSVDVNLKVSERGLDEVVVVGYGEQRKSEVTGATSTVSAKEIAKRPLSRLEQALQGTTAGVMVVSQNGQPGQGLRVKIRGANSITGSNEPLYVIDGNIGSGSDVNVNDVESIEILKDAASTAIYGSRGSNGVVMITTKSGKSGKMQINLESWVQQASIPRKLKLMNAYDFARSVNSQFVSTGSTPAFNETQLQAFKQNGGTDWQDELHTKPFVKNYQLDVSGGTDAVKYRFSLGYLDQPGVILNQSYKRASFRSNIDTRINDRMNIKFIVAATIPQNHNNSYGGGLGDPFNQAVEWDPTSPIRDPVTGNYISHSSYASIQFNPIAQANNQRVDNTSTNVSGTGTFTYKILNDLTFTSTNVYSLGSGFGQQVFGPGTGAYDSKSDYAQINSNRSHSFLSSNFLTYKKKFGDHSLTVTGLYEVMSGQNTAVQALAKNLSTYALGYYNLSLGGTQQTSSTYSADVLRSYMGRVNYSFKEKYFVTASIRTDGSSHLTDKYSSFPSVGVSWNIANEDFLKDSRFINNLKIRASYGQTGNQAVAAYSTIPVISTGGTQPSYYFDGSTPSVATPLGSPVSPSLKWEVKTSYDVGIDAAFLNGRLTFTADAYKNTINDLLYNYQAPFYLGGGTYSRNIGSVSNKGLEFALGGTPVVTENLRWNTNFTIAFNRNKVLDLGGLDNVITGGVTNQGILKVGMPLGEFYGFDFQGTWKSNEAAQAAAFGMKPGDAKYRDVNGDKAYTSADYVPIGNGTPKYSFGFINDVSYKAFTLSFMFQGTQGNQKFSQTQAYLWGGLGDMKNATTVEAVPENLWSPEHETNNPAWSNTGKNYNLSSRYVYNASYIKLKNVAISYRIPTDLLSKIRVRSLEVYVSGQNLFMITPYKGYDPEVENGNDAISQGQEFGVIPNPRTYTVGVRLGL
ncbi:SusC/RagA family TonB-linked outer membrane protein [Dyadobacter subterraneus]|uniref:TonB-dependent receptor n=1 Tax=Dyadobacter subterraneus TaxID=2773304 RepID=A0ABR9WH22_9BACT|nr:TonB-dependent receptor [Dyadobacter subterraneus]MBE9464740.1 TonB-dependent receptor [Dyadobacter subterraneus]